MTYAPVLREPMDFAVSRTPRLDILTGRTVLTVHDIVHDSRADLFPSGSLMGSFCAGISTSVRRGCRDHEGAEQHDAGEKAGADVLRFHE